MFGASHELDGRPLKFNSLLYSPLNAIGKKLLNRTVPVRALNSRMLIRTKVLLIPKVTIPYY